MVSEDRIGTAFLNMNSINVPFAKWLDESGQLPPVAFVVPLTHPDLELLESAPTGEAGQKWVTEWATTEFKSRYASVLTRCEDQALVTKGQTTYLDERIHNCRQELARTPDIIVSKKTTAEFPSGFLGRWLIFIGSVLCSQFAMEWYNGASFARFELQDMLAALSFTYSLALVPVALKLFCGEASLWKRLLFISFTCLAQFLFVHVFTDTYITSGPNLSSDQILDQIGHTPAQFPRFWADPLNPRWRFLWQTVLFTLIGFAFSNHLARHVSVITTTEKEENPRYKEIEEKLKALTSEREAWGSRQAEAEGNCREWQASLERHILRCVAHFHEEEHRRRDEETLENFLKQKVERRTRRFSANNLN